MSNLAGRLTKEKRKLKEDAEKPQGLPDEWGLGGSPFNFIWFHFNSFQFISIHFVSFVFISIHFVLKQWLAVFGNCLPVQAVGTPNIYIYIIKLYIYI